MFKYNLFFSILYFFNCINIIAQTNDCAYSGTALTVGTSCSTVTFDSNNNTDYWNSASGCSASDNDDAWWWFTATATSTIITYNSSNDAILHVFTGACATNMTAIACANNTTSGDETITITTVVGQNYAIRIQRNASDQNMSGTICVYSTVPPSNNLCSNATSLPCGTTNLAGTTVNSTNVAHGTGCTMSNFGVWYTFVGDGQQTTISSTAASGFDHEMAIASGSCGSLTNIACRDAALSGGTESYTFNTVNGVTYYVYIANWSSGSTTTGTFTISRTCTAAPTSPVNDLCSNATSLPCGTTNLAGTTVNSSNISPLIGCSISNFGVWYTFVGDGQQTTISSTGASGYDHEMAIASGSCASLTNITCQDNSGSGGTETFTFTTINGVTYYIYIANWSSSSTSTGTFTISRTCTTAPSTPVNDLCSSATSLPCGTTSLAGTTVNSSNIAHGTGCLISNYGVWYTFVGDGQQTTISSTSASGFDHEMAVASGSCGSLTNINCEDAALSGGTETYTFTTVNGVNYYVYIAHYSSSSTTTGTFTITRTCTPAGGGGSAVIQNCVGAMTVCSDATVPGNASGQGIEEINSSNNGCLSSSFGENQSSWYVFSPATSGNIALFMDVATSTDYDWAIWGPYPSGSTTSTICPPNQQPIRCSFASGGTTFSETGSYDTGMGSTSHNTPQFAPPTPSIYDGTSNTLNGWTPGLQVTAGQVYILLVDNWSADSNPFTLNFTLSGGATLGCTVLPIELLDFNVKNLGYENLIDWNTISEMNSDLFVIERLSNEENEFYEIGKMKAMGNSHIQVGYAFIDKKPNYGYNYYRLKMVDFDGTFKYSEIVAIRNLFDANFAVKNIYPNPTNNDFNIDIVTNTNEDLVITLTDVYGKKLNQFEYSVINGNNTIKINTDRIESGLIFVNITSPQNSNINITQKIVKQ